MLSLTWPRPWLRGLGPYAASMLDFHTPSTTRADSLIFYRVRQTRTSRVASFGRPAVQEGWKGVPKVDCCQERTVLTFIPCPINHGSGKMRVSPRSTDTNLWRRFTRPSGECSKHLSPVRRVQQGLEDVPQFDRSQECAICGTSSTSCCTRRTAE